MHQRDSGNSTAPILCGTVVTPHKMLDLFFVPSLSYISPPCTFACTHVPPSPFLPPLPPPPRHRRGPRHKYTHRHTYTYMQMTKEKSPSASCERLEIETIHAQLLMVAWNSLKFSLLADSPFLNQITWGHSSIRRSWQRSLLSTTPVRLAALTALSFFVASSQFEGLCPSLSGRSSKKIADLFPKLMAQSLASRAHLLIYAGLLCKAALLRYLSYPINTGQPPPPVLLLAFPTNGLWARVVTHVLYLGLCWFEFLDPGFVPRKRGGRLVAAMNLAGFLLSEFAYAKAYLIPTHLDDRTFSGRLVLAIRRLLLVLAAVNFVVCPLISTWTSS